MDKNFSKARIQGMLGAVCILIATASWLAADQTVLWAIRILAWLFALTFFHYALVRVQELSGANVFTVFKYAYNSFLAVILCTVALYVFDKNFHELIFRVIIPLAVFAVYIAWVVINLKLARASDCALFSVCAWALAASIGANFLYGVLEVLAPALITPVVVKFTPLINALFDVALAGVLFAAWVSVESFSAEQGEINLKRGEANSGMRNLSEQGVLNLSGRHAGYQASERKFDGANEAPGGEQNLRAQNADANDAATQNLRQSADEQILSEQISNLRTQSEPNFAEKTADAQPENQPENAQKEQAAGLKFDAAQERINANLNQRKNVQEDIYKQETLQAAKKQGIISCWFLLAIFAANFLIKVYSAFAQPSEADERLIGLAGDVINIAFSLVSVVYMWFALKKLEQIYDTDAFAIYKRSLGACAALFVAAIAYGLIRGPESEPATAGASLVGIFVLAIVIYLVVLWFKLNFELASVTQNKLFKTYVFFAIAVLIAALTLQTMLVMGYFTTLFSILLAALAVAVLYVLPTAFYLYAWTRLEEYFEA